MFLKSFVLSVEEELTMGQRLALKHLLVDPKEKERLEAQKAAEEAAAAKAEEGESSEAESEWTWETWCQCYKTFYVRN
jgi:hypothetical protein